MGKFAKLFAFASFLVFLLTGCSAFPSNNGGNGEEYEHLHHLEFKHDFYDHWAECTTCGDKYDPYDNKEKEYDDDSKEILERYEESEFRGNGHMLEYFSETDAICAICNARLRYSSGHDENQHWDSILDLDSGESEDEYRANHDFKIFVMEPTYDSLGYTTKTCQECGYSCTTDYVDKLDHHYTDLLFDGDHHWRNCTDHGYEDLIVDYSTHTYGKEISRYHEGDLQGNYTYHVCECGYEENVTYRYSPSELKTAEYLKPIHLVDNKYWDGVQLNEKAQEEKPELLVIPPYIDGYPVNGLSYSFNDVEIAFYASISRFVKKIYLPVTFHEFDGIHIRSGFKRCLDKLEMLEEVHCHPFCKNAREEDGIIYYFNYAVYFSKSRLSITLKKCNGIIDEECLNNRPNLKHIYVDDSSVPVRGLTLEILKKCPNLLLNKKTTEYYLGNGNGNDYSYCLGSDDKEITSVSLEQSCRVIAPYAFEDFLSLSEVDIKDNIVEIGGQAFKNCTSLRSITYSGTIESWNAMKTKFKGCFEGVSNLVIIHCTDGDITL